jgi:hypothetical protein
MDSDPQQSPSAVPNADVPGVDGDGDQRSLRKREALRRALLEQRILAEQDRWESRHDPFSTRNLFGRLGAMAITIFAGLFLPLLGSGRDAARQLLLLGLSAALLLVPVIVAASVAFVRTLHALVTAETSRDLRGRWHSCVNAVVSIATVITAYAALYAFIGFRDVGTCAAGAGSCTSHSFRAALFLSLTTITTTGYGDLTVVGWGRLVSAAQQITGVLMFGGFVAALMKFSERPTPPPPMGRVRVLQHAVDTGKDDAWIESHLKRVGHMSPQQLEEFLELLDEERGAAVLPDPQQSP